jgi:hypothetical protein
MRTELYADSRDVWKWSVAIKHAQQSAQSIFWVAMLRPGKGRHGNDRKVVQGSLPKVGEFFAREREYLDLGHPKSLSRITNLCSETGIELFCDMEAYPAALGQRGRYFSRLVDALRARQRHLKYLVLLDPDNGIGQARTKGEQIHTSHLQLIWDATRKGDTLAVVQFQQFIPKWVASLQQKIACWLAVDVTQVCSHAWDNICLYLINRSSS